MPDEGVNSLIREHLPATYFEEYQSLRPSLLEILTDDDLGLQFGGSTVTLGQLCREMGEVEYSYTESLRSFRLDFSYKHPDDSVATSVAALTSWYEQLDEDLESAIAALTEDEIANARIMRDLEGDGFAPPPARQLDLYREGLLIFYAKVSIYLRHLEKPPPARWQAWIG
jgi:hypothetical protein